jgi:hypothetical protein
MRDCAQPRDISMQTLPDIFGITREGGKTTLVCARTEEEAVEKYNAYALSVPHLNRPAETIDSVVAVQAIT